ncbi:MAG: response regulator [Cyanobacteriota bacterium]|nr:response regulator [Cyanobacteriota bacterium]
MSLNLDPLLLQNIAQEARQCFLEEDAPSYLEALQKALRTPQNIDYAAIMRAAHSLKGGAGLAQLPSLSHLAHRLEDLVELLQKGQIADPTTAWELIRRSVDETAYVLDQAQTQVEVQVDAALLQALAEFHAEVVASAEPAPLADELPPLVASPSLVKTALQVDLEDCLKRMEAVISSQPPPDQLLPPLEGFVEECTLLAEALSLPWLAESAQGITEALAQPEHGIPLMSVARLVTAEVRRLRDDFLQQLKQAAPTSPLPLASEPRLAESLPEVTPASALADEGMAAVAPSLIRETRPLNPSVRIPLSRVEQMTDQVGELIVRFERLSIQEQQLKQSNQELQRLAQQFQPVRDQVKALYDQLTTVNLRRLTTTTTGSPEGAATEASADFDPLEMDRYTTLHTSLQSFEELIARIQEARADIDLVYREISENLEQGRQDLDLLYNQVTRSRLVPFRTLAERFVPQLNRLAQRFQKQMELRIEGENVLVDQVILEQLQTPLTHLLNNAVDHGIESSADRLALEKPAVAQILLQAKLEGNQVVITFGDDGRGIDLAKVYQKAVERHLCPPHVSFGQLRREQVLEFIFQSGFSTAAQVSEVSGRGVGLDAVRRQIGQLRGTLQVESRIGQGTSFTIRLPLGLSLLPLMLCQTYRRLVALPATSVLEILPYAEAQTSPSAVEEGRDPLLLSDPAASALPTMDWRGQRVPLLPLAQLLPYANPVTEVVPPRVVILVQGSLSPIAIAIDGLIGERQLILKPFDDTIPVPPYVAGCTILGTGDVVPVVLPYHFQVSTQPRGQTADPQPLVSQQSRTILIAEDSVATRRAVEKILSQAGYITIACRDGQEALDELRQRQGSVDMVLTDIEMPRLSGFDLLQSIRAHSEWYALPVALLTSRTGERYQQRALSLGANAYLNKPVDAKLLLQKVETLFPETVAGSSR